MKIALGPGPTLLEALDDISRVGEAVGGARAKKWATELREIAAKLGEGARWGPKGSTWPVEAARLKLAATIAERGWKQRQAFDGAKALAAALPELAAKAVDADDQLEVLAVRLDLEAAIREEAEQLRLDPRNRA